MLHKPILVLLTFGGTVKKFLVIVIGSLFVAALNASATTITIDCQGQAQTIPPAAGDIPDITCPGAADPGPGFTFTAIRLGYTYDITQGFGGGGASAEFIHNVLTVGLDAFDDLTFELVTDVSQPETYQIQVLDPTGAQVAAVLGGTTIRGSFQNAQGIIESVSLDVQWQLDYFPIPEPSTFALLGAGLVGVAAARRRRA